MGQDARALLRAVHRLRASAVSRSDGGQTLAVEAGDQMGDGIAGPTACRVSRLGEGLTLGDRQQNFGAGDLSGGTELGAGDLFELRSLLIREQVERLLLFSWHDRPPGGRYRAVYPHRPRKAMSMSIDSLPNSAKYYCQALGTLLGLVLAIQVFS